MKIHHNARFADGERICLFQEDDSVCQSYQDYQKIHINELPQRITPEALISVEEIVVAESLTIELEKVYPNVGRLIIASKDILIKGSNQNCKYTINPEAVLTIKLPEDLKSIGITDLTINIPQVNLKIDGNLQADHLSIPTWIFQVYKEQINVGDDCVIEILDLDPFSQNEINLATYSISVKAEIILIISTQQVDEFIDLKIAYGEELQIGSTTFTIDEAKFIFTIYSNDNIPFRLCQSGLSAELPLKFEHYNHESIWLDETFTPDLPANSLILSSELQSITVYTLLESAPFLSTTIEVIYQLPPDEITESTSEIIPSEIPTESPEPTSTEPSSEPTPEPTPEPIPEHSICIYRENESKCGTVSAIKDTELASTITKSQFDDFEQIVISERVHFYYDTFFSSDVIIESSDRNGKFRFLDGSRLVLHGGDKQSLTIDTPKNYVSIFNSFTVKILEAPLWFCESNSISVKGDMKITQISPNDNFEHHLMSLSQSNTTFVIENEQSTDYVNFTVINGHKVLINGGSIVLSEEEKDGQMIVMLTKVQPLRIFQIGLNENRKLTVDNYLAENIQFDASFKGLKDVVIINSDLQKLIIETDVGTGFIENYESSSWEPTVKPVYVIPKKKFETWKIAVIAVSAVVAIAIVIVLIIVVKRKRYIKEQSSMIAESLKEAVM